MRKLLRGFQSRSVGFIIIATCVTIVLVLTLSIVVATFTSFRTSSGEAVGTQTRELSAQIVYNYENYISSMIETSNTIQTDIDRYAIHTADGAEKFAVYLSDIMHLKDDIGKIAVYDNTNGRCFSSSDPDEIGEYISGDDNQWFYEAIADPTVHMFSIPYTESGNDAYIVNISKQIKYQNSGKLCVLKIEISFQNFIELVQKSNLGEGGHITIIDPMYNIVYTSLPREAAADEIDVIRGIVLGSESATVNGHDMAINVDTLSNTKWRICVFINVDKLGEIERSFLATTILVSLSVLIAGIMLFLSASRMITNPMKQLERAMRKVEKSDYFRMEEVELTASREVAALASRFNKMMLKINELMERVIVEQNAQRRSELRALQNQINPHFLYNTLDSIVWMIENHKNERAQTMVVALAKLFRIGISNDSEVIPVRDEIEHARNYLFIQSNRYSDSFDYEFFVDESLMDVRTMKLVLQPLIENCIYHGLKNKIDRGKITISTKREGDYLLLSVSDNGYGIRQETIDALYASFRDGVVSDSVGLKNIYQRVMIYYGGDAEMRIESEPDEGTTITIKEPISE